MMKSIKAVYHAASSLALMALGLLLFAAPAHAVGTAAGTTISNTASISYSDASANSFTAVSNTVDITVTAVYTVSVSCTADQNANSNTTGNYACTLTNTSNAPNTFALTASSLPAWGTAIIVDTNGDGVRQGGETTATATTGALAADATYKFFMSVTVPANTVNGTTSIATLTVVGSGDAGVGDDTTVARTTTAQAPALSVSKKVRNVTTAGSFVASGVTAKPTDVLEYQLLVTNNGTVQASNDILSDVLNANVTYSAGTIWIGSNGTANNGGTNANKTDATAGDAVCATDACGAANFTAGTLTFNLGTGATELVGGSLAPASAVYVYYRVTVK
jgi:uncharacterized repeat protein (TIGR01451 family)